MFAALTFFLGEYMQPTSFALFLAGAALLSATATAATPNMKAGMWEVTTTMEMDGMPNKIPPTTIKHCVTPEDVAKTNPVLPKNDKCEVKMDKGDSAKMSWSMQCTGDRAMNGSGSITFNGDSYAGNMDVTVNAGGRAMHMTNNYTGRRIGDCSK
jgi:Protein of unknown function (DUF3617)